MRFVHLLSIGLVGWPPVAAVAQRFRPRSDPGSQALSITPAENWDGIDGQWNTFYVQVGTPAQSVRVLASTASEQTLVVLGPAGCSVADDVTACGDDRGLLFRPPKSTTWDPQGTWDFDLEQNLGYTGNGEYGLDTVSLGSSIAGSESPTVDNVTVAAFAVYDFYLGLFGLNPKPTNLTDMDDPIPSWLTRLRNQSDIPSLSWGYTAGMPYEGSTGVLASLTLGGYDASRFESNDVEFVLGSDNDRDIVVNLQSVSMSGTSRRVQPLLSSPIYAYIDSTVPQLWLPKTACDAFEEAFKLDYDHVTDLYFISDSAHQQLKAQNPTVTFTIATEPSSDQTIDINFPYAAFYHLAKPPYQGLTSEKHYFPLRRAHNDTQYTLGRTFLQEAYLTVDWERGNFSVSQAVYEYGATSNVVSIISPDPDESDQTNPNSGSSSLSGGIIAAIVIAVVAVIALVIVSYLLLRRRRRDRVYAHRLDSTRSTSTPRDPGAHSDGVGKVIPKAELDATQPAPCEVDGKVGFYAPESAPKPDAGSTPEAEAHEIFEVLGDLPPEAAGRQLGEKEAMVHRAGMYNGVNTTEANRDVGVDGTSDNAMERPRTTRVNPQDVVEVSQQTLQPRSSVPGQVSPLAPMDAADMDRMASPMTRSLDDTADVNRKRFSYEEE